jgi:predicted RNase H-like nuclease (RuvC/YqgF family)
MWMVESQYYHRVRAQLKSSQGSCEDSLAELMECIDRLLQVLSIHVEEALMQSMECISKRKTEFVEMMTDTLTKIAAIEDQIDSVRVSSKNQHSGLVMLLEENSILKSQIKRMVNENELIEEVKRTKKATHLSLEYEQRIAEQRKVIDDLNQCLREAQTEKEALTNSMKVV